MTGGSFNINGGEISNNTVRDNTTSGLIATRGGGIALIGGILTINEGDIINNTVTGQNGRGGGGVSIDGGTLTMNAGKISDNTFSFSLSYLTVGGGGGVFMSSGNFTMRGGEINNNTAFSTSTSSSLSTGADGGGIYINGTLATFTIWDGLISGNNVNQSGGGIFGSFTMNGGEISNNTARMGGGVFIPSGRTFTMNGGKISNNSANSGISPLGGGGVNVVGTFTLNSGEIFGNSTIDGGIITNRGSGGGVRVEAGTFHMRGGHIFNNTSQENGGGIFFTGGVFDKTGGIINGYMNDTLTDNVVRDRFGIIQNDKGHAVFISRNSIIKRKESTSDINNNLTFIGIVNPPTWDGDWDF